MAYFKIVILFLRFVFIHRPGFIDSFKCTHYFLLVLFTFFLTRFFFSFRFTYFMFLTIPSIYTFPLVNILSNYFHEYFDSFNLRLLYLHFFIYTQFSFSFLHFFVLLTFVLNNSFNLNSLLNSILDITCVQNEELGQMLNVERQVRF